MPCPQSPTDEPEDFTGFLRRISSPPTPALDKLQAFAKAWREEEELEKLRIAESCDYWDSRSGGGE